MEADALIACVGIGLVATGMLCGLFFKLGCVDNKVKTIGSDVCEIKTTVLQHTKELSEIKQNGSAK